MADAGHGKAHGDEMRHGHGHGHVPGQSPDARTTTFLDDIVARDGELKRWGRHADGTPKVHTRFPPEPNGYLHIGHSKSICLNYGLALRNKGKFNLRFDDTNPAKEEQEYVDSIKRDVKWLGADFESGPAAGGVFWASDYFEKMYDFAMDLVNKGLAYVCELSGEEVSKRRGTPSVPATSPFRDRPIGESQKLLTEMREGKHPTGAMTLRAKIDLASPNFNLRDPVMYRILHEEHHNTGKAWCIYPMYDWAHGIEDSLEGITHSICTLEFENHRPLYDWFINAINQGRAEKIHHSQQIEFAKLQITYILLSKRNLLKMVQSGTVRGWDDPRMPTISGFRRRGYTSEAIRAFCEDVGVTRTESLIDIGRLENACRDHLNKIAPRRMAVLDPVKVVIENYPEGQVEEFEAVNNPEDADKGVRLVPFSRELFIDRDDFMENPPKKFFRLAPGTEVRLRAAYWIKCVGIEKDASGNITLIRCTYDAATKGGENPPPGPDGVQRKVKGTIHWVSAAHAVNAEVRLFDRLFKTEEPGKATGNYVDDLNPQSLTVVTHAKVEPAILEIGKDEPVWVDGIRRFQFERTGYFAIDPDSKAGALVFNRTVSLKDTWAKIADKS
jgi:glutaminyl-tRNA synthetase